MSRELRSEQKMSGLIKEWYTKFLKILGTNITVDNSFNLDSVILGQFVFYAKDTTFNKIVNAEIQKPEIVQKILFAKTNLERVVLMNKSFPDAQFKELLNELENLFKKDENIAKIFQRKGDDQKTFDMSVRCYNLAALFAPIQSACLGDIYAERSALFHKENENPLCLKDIELALKNNCSENIKVLLLELKEHLFKQFEPQKIVSSKIRKYKDEVIFKVDGMHSTMFPSGIEGLRIKFNDKKGRHLTTDCELKPGTTVIVEDPFAIILNKAIQWDTEHCGKCLERIKSTIPCESCVFVSYCSEECRLEDQRGGHLYECKCYPHLHSIRSNNQSIALGLKAICKEGPDNLFKRWKELSTEAVEENNHDYLMGIDPKTGKYDSASYHPLLYLKWHLEETRMTRMSWIAVSIIKVLDFKTDFFRKSNNYNNDDFKLYVASLLLLHFVSFQFNGASLIEKIEIEQSDDAARKYEHVHKASGIYSLISVMCHSCDPSVFRQDLPNGRIAIITKRHLYPGDELELSYGYEFLWDEFDTRRFNILNHYKFNCECIACRLKWPTYKEMIYDRKYLCLNCSDNYKDSLIVQDKQCMLTLSDQNGVTTGCCNHCKKCFELTETMNEIDRIENLLTDADVLMKENKPIEAIFLLIESIEFLQSRIAPLCKEMIYAQITLFKAYHMITKS